MFRPTWPSSGVYDVSLFIPEGICFAAFVAFVARATKAAKQIPSGIKSETSYTPEYGHVVQNSDN
jgi:hypothetical protein